MSIIINQGNPCHNSNYSSRGGAKIQYIVIHYTANNGDTAQGNCSYFSSPNRGASAHYFVGEDGVYQSVPDNMRAWHCGGAKTYKHKYCRNANSIGIEMCSRKNANGYYINDNVITQTIELTKYLMEKYNISTNNVIRHYDVWSKQCPEPFVRNPQLWTDFKNKLTASNSQSHMHWGQEFLNKLISTGHISDVSIWSKYDEPVTKSQAAALIDKCTGGTWSSGEANSSIHWVQPYVISLCGKHIITDKEQWLNNPDIAISKALFLALIDKATGGIKENYINRSVDHWGRNHLDSLCDKAIIDTPGAWTDLEAEVSRANCMALICKALM